MFLDNFYSITLGQIVTIGAVIVGTCKGIHTIRQEFKKIVLELHEGVMAQEERRINGGEETTLYRIIANVYARLRVLGE